MGVLRRVRNVPKRRPCAMGAGSKRKAITLDGERYAAEGGGYTMFRRRMNVRSNFN